VSLSLSSFQLHFEQKDTTLLQQQLKQFFQVKPRTLTVKQRAKKNNYENDLAFLVPDGEYKPR
jgi:hypothetical protein